MRNLKDWTPKDRDLLVKNFQRLGRVWYKAGPSDEDKKKAVEAELRKIEAERVQTATG
jgi:hypothetical protein